MIASATIAENDPINAIVTLKSVAIIIPNGFGTYLLGLSIDNIGNGSKSKRSATVEKVDPVGVKLTDFANSNGRKIPK